jgi:hypothetical protein
MTLTLPESILRAPGSPIFQDILLLSYETQTSMARLVNQLVGGALGFEEHAGCVPPMFGYRSGHHAGMFSRKR